MYALRTGAYPAKGTTDFPSLVSLYYKRIHEQPLYLCESRYDDPLLHSCGIAVSLIAVNSCCERWSAS